MQITLSVFALVVLSAFSEAKPIRDEPSEPSFCNGLECPHFNTINKTDKYEVRSYPTAYKWASTVVAGRKFAFFCFSVYSFPSVIPSYTKRAACHYMSRYADFGYMWGKLDKGDDSRKLCA